MNHKKRRKRDCENGGLRPPQSTNYNSPEGCRVSVSEARKVGRQWGPQCVWMLLMLQIFIYSLIRAVCLFSNQHYYKKPVKKRELLHDDGQLLQVQYAQETVRQGCTALGIRGKDVIVLAAEKKNVAKLQIERTEKKIVALDEHVVLAFAGLRADARVLISRAQIECQSHRLQIEEPVRIDYITRYIGEMKQKYTQSNGKRPFGISCLIGGFDSDGTPRLFQTEPSGIYNEWMAHAIGREDKIVREFLEQNYSTDLVGTDIGALKLAISALLQVTPIGHRNIDVTVVKNGPIIYSLEPEAINSIAAEIEEHYDSSEKNGLKIRK